MSGSASQAAIATGQVVTAARLNNYPQGVLERTQSTSDASSTSGTTELDVHTASAVTIAEANRRLKISWHCRGISCTNAGDLYTVRIKEGSTTLGESNYYAANTDAMGTGGCDFAAYVDNPSAGSHTYKVTIQRVIGGGSATVRGSSNGPRWLTVEDVGLA